MVDGGARNAPIQSLFPLPQITPYFTAGPYIDVVRPGLSANVRFTALRQRNTAPAPGVVRTISADRLVDPATGESYFVAIVELDEGDKAVPAELLYSGMTAEVMIKTGERSALAYLFEPLTNSLNRAFREN